MQVGRRARWWIGGGTVVAGGLGLLLGLAWYEQWPPDIETVPAPLALRPAPALTPPVRIDPAQWPVRWRQRISLFQGCTTGNPGWFFQPLDGGGLAYSDDEDNSYLLAADGSIQTPRWPPDPDLRGTFTACSVAPARDGGLLVYREGNLYRLAADGTQRWQASLPGAAAADSRQIHSVEQADQIDVLSAAPTSGGDQSWELAPDGRLLRHTSVLAAEWGQPLAAGPDGGLLAAGTTSQGYAITSIAASGQVLWRKVLRGPDVSRVRGIVSLGDGGSVLLTAGGACRLDPAGHVQWCASSGLVSVLPCAASVTPAGLTAIWAGGALHYLDRAGRDALPPLGVGEEAAQYGFSFPLWVQAPDGTSYCLVLDQAEDQDYAAPGTLFAVSSQGAALWRARVEPGFRLLAATDSGLLYALERLHTTSHDAFSAHAEADVVCLDVMPPAPAR